jgi:outer membrane protein assembly factor BamB
LYFTTDAGKILYAVRDSGSSLDEIWKFTADYAFKWQSPALATSGPTSGTIYISAGNYLYAIYSGTGVKKWDLDLVSAGTYTTPAIGADGSIYLNDGHSSLVKITDTGSAGDRKWDYNIAGSGLASPAIGPDGTIYIGNNNASSVFWAINDNGTLKWQRDGLGAADASAVIGADSTVYYQTRSGTFYALDGANGTTKWSYPLSGGLSAAAIDAGGCVYVGNWDGKLYCFAPPAPTVASITPAQGTPGQTLTVVLTGSNFFGRPSLAFSGTGITVNSVAADNLTQLTASITIGNNCTPGLRDVTVSTGGGTATLTGGFRVLTPPATTVVSITPAQGTPGQTLTIVVTGTNFYGSPTVSLGGTGITVNSITVNSLTQLTVNITIADSCAPGFSNVVVTTSGGTITLINGFLIVSNPVATNSNLIQAGANNVGGSSSIGTTQPAQPMGLPNIQTQSASLSAATVPPGTPVTVTANIVNKSAVNGNKKVTLYVNGQVETTQGITVNSGGTSQLTFYVSRSDPGDYSVYVDGVPAGRFKVEMFRESDGILIFSIVMLAMAFVGGLVMLWRRQRAV